MNTLTLLLPPRQRLAADAELAGGLLARWFGKGDRLPDAAPGRDAALRELFQFAGTRVPVAALTREADRADATGATWLRADPAHVRADMATARLLACGDLGLSADDAESLLRPLRPLFGDSGFPVDAPTPARWYLRAPAGARLPQFSAPEQALGDDLRQHLPDGDEARRWRSLLNEAQIVLHNHPLNQQRIARGQLPVNSLWFWGGGSLPEWVKTAQRRVQTNDLVLAALARRAGVAVTAPGQAMQPGDLIDLDDAEGLAALATRWLPAAAAALADGTVDLLQLNLASGERLQLRRAHRWRFWRAPRPLRA